MSNPLVSAGGNDLFLLKLKANGDVAWAKRWGDMENQLLGSVAVDPSDNIIISGGFAGALDFGPGNNLVSMGEDDIYVAKLQPDGTTSWAKQFGDDKAQAARGIAVTDLGEVVIAGVFSGVVNFGDGNVMSAGVSDIFVTKLANSGALTWKRVVGSAMAETVNDMAVDSEGNIVITGYYQGSITFGSTMLSNAGEQFVAKMTSSGADVWAKSFLCSLHTYRQVPAALGGSPDP